MPVASSVLIRFNEWEPLIPSGPHEDRDDAFILPINFENFRSG
jgi:hypothetical protein